MNIDQMKMAHEYAILHLAKPENVGVEDSEIVAWAWDYVDLMQAEAEKREKEIAAKKRAEIKELLNADNTFVEREGQHFDDVEWKPDWSQAPDWAKYWSIAEDGDAYWFKEKPRIAGNYFETTYCGYGEKPFKEAPSFNYTGDWRNSLRMRPEGV